MSFLGEDKTRVISVANIQGNCTWKQIHLTRDKVLCFHSITFISEHRHTQRVARGLWRDRWRTCNEMEVGECDEAWEKLKFLSAGR